MNSFLKRKLLGLFVKTKGVLSHKLFSGIGHIVTLHRIVPQSPFIIQENKALEMAPETLEKYISYYRKQQYEFVSLDELYNRLINKSKHKKKCVVLTFDDGYIDTYTYAYPLLKKLEVPFTLFITTSFPDKQVIMWWYLIEDLIRDKDELYFSNNEINYHFKCKSNQDKQHTFIQLRELFRQINIQSDAFKKLISSHNIDIHKYAYTETLNWENIIEMSNHPLASIGAHSVNHPVFKLCDEQTIINEAVQSKLIIENFIKKEVHHFAYPFGGQLEIGVRETNILKKLPFKTCVTSLNSNIFKKHSTHLEALPRVHWGNIFNEEKTFNLLKGITQFSQSGIKNSFLIN